MAGNKVQVFTESVKLIIEREFPDLAGPYHYPVKGRVLIARSSNADVQLLDRDGTASSTPPLPRVPYPSDIVLTSGDLVRVGFYYNDPAQAFIEAKI